MIDILVEGAADWELAPLIDALDNRQEQRHTIWTCWQGAIGSQSVAVVRTDWGPINAVAATVAALQVYQPRAIICQGMAGAHNPELVPGDIVVARRSVDYSAFKSDSTGAREAIRHRLRVDSGKLKEFDAFDSDPALVDEALAQHNPHGRLLAGVVGSAYQYNRLLDDLRQIRLSYGTECEDMESAYAAGAAAIHGVPFLAIRMISNSEFTSPELDKRAGAWCAEFVVHLIRARVPSAHLYR